MIIYNYQYSLLWLISAQIWLTQYLSDEGKHLLLLNHIQPHLLYVWGGWWLVEAACTVSPSNPYSIWVFWEYSCTCVYFICIAWQMWSLYTMRELRSFYLHLTQIPQWAHHRILPGQLSSVPEQRKPQNQAPVSCWISHIHNNMLNKSTFSCISWITCSSFKMKFYSFLLSKAEWWKGSQRRTPPWRWASWWSALYHTLAHTA